MDTARKLLQFIEVPPNETKNLPAGQRVPKLGQCPRAGIRNIYKALLDHKLDYLPVLFSQ